MTRPGPALLECFGLEVPVMFGQLGLRTALRSIVHDWLTTTPPPAAGSVAARYHFLVIAAGRVYRDRH